MDVDSVAEGLGVELSVLEPRDVLDSSLVGVVFRSGGLVCGYDVDLLRESLMSLNPSWDEEEASEWIAYNAVGRVALLEVVL